LFWVFNVFHPANRIWSFLFILCWFIFDWICIIRVKNYLWESKSKWKWGNFLTNSGIGFHAPELRINL
jgi:hypothetical protein